MRIHEIAQLTDYQVRHVYFRPRDEDGELIRREGKVEVKVENPVSFKEMYFQLKRDAGVAEEEIQSRWENYLRQNPRADGA